ncbi:methyltransferase domain-containing protein [Streptomyces sp. NPDC057654]|uniref:methyltransferase domain-containing protein n=1 Tax=Streptomyces sp. NPDC057654 TaxID=3346196 RepID=UPI0036BC025D
MDAAALRQQCADEIDTYRGGYFHGRPWLRAAFLSIPRQDFVPERVWRARRGDGGRYPVVDRRTNPEWWLRAVYEPRAPLITQIADGQVRIEDGATDNADFTSSISCSSVTVNMLHHLDPQPGDRVLEIGTGTGYSTALLAARVKAEHITTMEIDPELAGQAEKRLARLGTAPHLAVGDGELGCAERAPYDRILSTACVQQIPPCWLEQLRPGGTLLTPLATPYGCDALARLTGDGQGRAHGRLVAAVNFMRVRGQRGPRPWRENGWFTFADLAISADTDGQHIRPHAT